MAPPYSLQGALHSVPYSCPPPTPLHPPPDPWCSSKLLCKSSSLLREHSLLLLLAGNSTPPSNITFLGEAFLPPARLGHVPLFSVSRLCVHFLPSTDHGRARIYQCDYVLSVWILTPAVWSLCRNPGSVARLTASNSTPLITHWVTSGSFISHLCEVR